MFIIPLYFPTCQVPENFRSLIVLACCFVVLTTNLTAFKMSYNTGVFSWITANNQLLAAAAAFGIICIRLPPIFKAGPPPVKGKAALAKGSCIYCSKCKVHR
jgi:hypothetical protein